MDPFTDKRIEIEKKKNGLLKIQPKQAVGHLKSPGKGGVFKQRYNRKNQNQRNFTLYNSH
jgi:hypothetical protein